ncbi:unannotated protein [freshwater metagenome]|uniref:Unannotated protein n=1 Tax=freshwater metagenome TaxID=449393 RepID=A0A6J7FAW3_9ZZZZ|nr:TIGR00730 family Rossman fold protein [Actinomycetota bacterium]MSW48310.1 TIGR00730 family Rossman fold protein [Actinomycetota bacterium]
MTSLVDLQKAISDLVDEFGSIHNTEYVMQLIATSLELGSDKTSTLDLKIASSALKEMREAFAMFQPFTQRRKVTIFGSARTQKDDPLYAYTQQVAKSLADQGWMVVTGAGPGIMEAGMEGAGRERSIGVSIRLPFESSANSIIAGDEKYVSMRYFFTRKLMLVKESQAFLCLPGGFGTLDETFELLTLTQTGKGVPVPIVLLDLPGDRFWHSIDDLIRNQLLVRGLVSQEDLALYRVCDSISDATSEIQNFYRNYHSIRYIGKHLIMRLNNEITASMIQVLNERFSHLCRSGEFEVVQPHSAEKSENDHVDKYRLRFDPNRSDAGGLRDLINFLNQGA